MIEHMRKRLASRQLSAATVVHGAVRSEDERSWRIQMVWNDGRLEHILCFDSREDAEGWINMELDREPRPK
jgi:hypothetical protein